MRLGRAYPVSRILKPPPAILNIEFDNSAMSAQQTAVSSGSLMSHAHTVGDNAYGIVAVFAQNLGGAMQISCTADVKFGGQTLTELGAVAANNNLTGAPWIKVFGGFVPSGAQNVDVTLTQSGRSFSGRVASYTYANVGAANSAQTAAGFGTSYSLNMSVTPNNWVWGGILGGGSVANFNLTNRQSQTSGGNPIFFSGDVKAASSSQTISATGGNTNWGVIGVELATVDNA